MKKKLKLKVFGKYQFYDDQTLKKIFRMMRLTVFCFFLGFMQVMAVESYAQMTKLSIKLNNEPLEQVLKFIEDESEFFFLYNRDLIDVEQKVSVNAENKTIKSILDDVLVGTDISFVVYDRQIVLTNTSVINEMVAQQSSVSGKVTDKSGQPLPGVTVVIKGTTQGTVTNADGNYTISNIPDDAVLQFSFVGMLTQEIVVGTQNTINISMIEEAIGIEEVVAVGYGTQKKVNLTGAVGTVSSEVLTVSVPTNTVAALQGRLPGVTITQTSGQPGTEDVSVLIRGMGTMNFAGPMVIVDGIESAMGGISPGDIESVSVLKDASSAAIYGSRAANGVILVTTKRGKMGKSEITYRGSTGWQKATSLPEHLSSAEYAELYNEGLNNQGIPARYSNEDIAKYRSGVDPYNFPNTDWQALLLTESGLTQNHSIAFSGGNDLTRYRTSFEYFSQDGLIKYSNHKRYNARINIDSKVREWFVIGLNTSLIRDNVTYPVSPFSGGEEFFRQTYYIPPTVSNKNADGTWNRHTDGNPIAWVNAGGNRNGNGSYLVGSVFGELKLLKGLTLKGVAGANYNIYDYKRHVVTIDYVENGVPSTQGPNSVTDEISRNQAITLQSVLNYDRRFDKHGIKALLGVSRESRQNSYNTAYRQNFPSNYLDQLNAGSSAGMTNGGYIDEDRLGSYFGRINYDFDNKYLFEVNLRRDASSKFAPAYRVGWFPSASAGWRVSQEDFMKNINWISNMKIRGSWGQLGNNSVPNYYYYQRIKLGQNYNFGGEVADGAAQTVPNNLILSWEKTTEFDLGFDVDLFQNKLISLSADYYNRYTDDILTSVPVSMVFGLPAPVVNAGAMRNKGVELIIDHNNVIGNFQYNISINGAYNENKVEKFANPSKGDQIYAEGISWGSYYGLEAIGIYQTDAEAAASAHIEGAPVKAGDLIFKDQNTDGKIDGDDRIVLGNTIPKFTYGFNISLKYKDFDLSAFFQGANNVYRTLGGETFWAFDPNNALKMHLDRTIVENGEVIKEGYYPRILTTEKHNQYLSSFSVLNASYLRMKNAQFGYTLPTRWLKMANISKIRVYASGQNLLTFTKFPSSFDPELGSGSANGSYPQVKFYTFGVDLTF
jgi:TonB-linked SusC/RagA family outer membrane protein